mmetsp:Transcript_74356/g.208762  ORF Transcript_74356/g.208762 Transcript_74356/m.208762 type:complete len:280 (+) Transcript_74356:96-935(+)
MLGRDRPINRTLRSQETDTARRSCTWHPGPPLDGSASQSQPPECSVASQQTMVRVTPWALWAGHRPLRRRPRLAEAASPLVGRLVHNDFDLDALCCGGRLCLLQRRCGRQARHRALLEHARDELRDLAVFCGKLGEAGLRCDREVLEDVVPDLLATLVGGDVDHCEPVREHDASPEQPRAEQAGLPNVVGDAGGKALLHLRSVAERVRREGRLVDAWRLAAGAGLASLAEIDEHHVALVAVEAEVLLAHVAEHDAHRIHGDQAAQQVDHQRQGLLQGHD